MIKKIERYKKIVSEMKKESKRMTQKEAKEYLLNF